MTKRLLEICERVLGVSRFVALVYLFAVASVSLNVLLAYRLRSLGQVQAAKIADPLLKVGSTVPPIAAVGLDGKEEVISSQDTDKDTVLYIFTPPCSWCARNLDNFKTLIDKESGQYRIIRLSLSKEGLVQYAAKNGLDLPIYSGLSMATRLAYRLSGTPETIVVSHEGRVLHDLIA